MHHIATRGPRRPARWRRRAAAVTVCAASVAGGAAHAEVNAVGDYTQTIQIEVPSFRGMAPSVSLSYSTARGGGIAGVGWTLDAFSTIVRSGPRDALPVGPPPGDDAGQSFRYDGEPLVACTATSTSPSCTTAKKLPGGSSVGYYSTRQESFRRFHHPGGLAPWTVWSTDGGTARLDTLDGGLTWLLARAEDVHHNGIDYAYSCAPGFECELSSITYGSTPAAIGAEIHFYYEVRPDVRQRATGTGFVVAARRLRSITVRVGGHLVRAYALDYAPSPVSGRSLLASVQQFAADAAVNVDSDPGKITRGATPPLPATTFTAASQQSGTGWQIGNLLGASGLFSLADLADAPAPRHYPHASLENAVGFHFDPSDPDHGEIPNPYQKLTGDFDGDGRADVVIAYVATLCRSVGFSGALTRKGGFVPIPAHVVVSRSPGNACTPTWWVADVDGDHRDDVLFAFRDALYTARLVNGQFEALPTAQLGALDITKCAIADVDGDSRSDLACLSAPFGTPYLMTMRSNGDGTFLGSGQSVLGVGTGDPMTAGDVNGDGFADLMFAAAAGSTRQLVTLVSDGDGAYAQEIQPTTWGIGSNDSLATVEANGDGLADLLYVHRGSGGVGALATAFQGATAPGRYTLRPLDTSWTDPLVADIDGDGKLDLVNKANLTAAVGNGTGGFAPPATAFGTADCPDALLADTDGDGRTDLICFDPARLDDEPFLVDDFPSNRPRAGTHRWLSADIDGDGARDFVYVQATNPGVRVWTVLTAETPHRVSWQPAAGSPVTDESSTVAWLAADVAGPDGRADGKDDLVLVDRSGPALRVYTMRSLGDGSFAAIDDTPWASYAEPDLRNFWPIDADGDGATDLVHVVAQGNGVRVDLLRSRGDGTWRASSTPYFATGATPFVAAGDFRPADLNGDGLTDLVNIQSGGAMAGTLVRSLLSRGGGAYAEVTDATAAQYLDVSRWQLVDVNGDGLSDLVHATTLGPGFSTGIDFTVLPARGDGLFGGASTATALLINSDPELAGALESTGFLYPADLNGDGLTDFLHVSTYRQNGGATQSALVRLINPGAGATTWRVEPPTKAVGTPVSGVAGWAWRPHVTATAPQSAAFAIIDAERGGFASVAVPPDRVARTDNGNGGRTDVSYKALVGKRAYLPAGMIPTVVGSVVRTDLAYTPATTETTTYDYDGARWSDDQRRVLGFATVVARGPQLIGVQQYATDEQCPGLVTASAAGYPAVYPAGALKVLTFSTNLPVAPGAAAPYTCLVEQHSQYACEGAPTCRLESDLHIVYDAYGNMVQTTETAVDGTSRTEYAGRVPNEVSFIVDRPAYRGVVEDEGGPARRLVMLETYQYDNQESYAQGPGDHGEVRRIHRYDDQTNRFVTSKVEYNADGMVTETADPLGRWQRTYYDPSYGAFPNDTCTALGCTHTEWDPGRGLATATVDLNGARTETIYDAHGRVDQVIAPGGHATDERRVVQTRILDLGRVTGAQAQRQRLRTEIRDGSPGDAVLWSEEYLDGWGRTYRAEREGGAAQVTEFDGLSSRPKRVSETFTSGTEPTHFTTYAYDPLGRPIRQVAPDGTVLAWQYSVGRVDATDQVGRVRTVKYDGRSQVHQVIEHDFLGDYTTTYRYDVDHRLLGIVDAAGNETSYVYDTLGRLIDDHDPDRGLHHHVYRDDGLVRETTDAKGQRITRDYDALGRLTVRKDFDAANALTRTVTWTYDELPGQGPQGASLGRLVQITDDQGATLLASRYVYDDAGRVEQDTECVDGVCMPMARTFDVAGRLADLIYPDRNGAFGAGEEVVTHRYDAAGRLRSVGGYVTSIDYEVDDLPKRLAFGNSTATTYDYDPLRRWTDHMKVDAGPSYILLDASYAHYPDGRIRDLGEDGVFTHYEYDELGRVSFAASSLGRLQVFEYDGIGRMTYQMDHDYYHYADPAHPHAMTSTDAGLTRSYDANGNVVGLSDVSGRTLGLHWSVDDHAVAIDGPNGSVALAYDVAGQRVKKHDASGDVTYFGALLALDHGVFQKYYYAEDRLIAQGVDGGLNYYHQNHTHSVRAMSTWNGELTNTYTYGAFGDAWASETFDNDVRLGSQHSDPELAVSYLTSRYYDSVSGQFLSADDVVRDPYSPQSLDRYSYVENDPVNFWDPSGHMRTDIELMMERKQFWRTLQVQVQNAMNYCALAPHFCTEGISSTRIAYDKNGKIIAVMTPSMDPAVAKYQWDKAIAGRQVRPYVPVIGIPGGGGGTSAGVAKKAGGGGGGGSGPLGQIMKILMGGGKSPELKIPVRVPDDRGTVTGEHTISAPHTAFDGVKVSVNVTVDDEGKVISGTPRLTGSGCKVESWEVVGNHVTAELTASAVESSVKVDLNSNVGGKSDSSSTVSGSAGLNGGTGRTDAGTLAGALGVSGSAQDSTGLTGSAGNGTTITTRTSTVQSYTVTFVILYDGPTIRRGHR